MALKHKMLDNIIYNGIIKTCEDYEGMVISNGHHLAQKLIPSIIYSILPLGQKRIIDVLRSNVNRWFSVREISDLVGDKSKNVSAAIGQLYKKTSMISRKKEANGHYSYIINGIATNT